MNTSLTLRFVSPREAQRQFKQLLESTSLQQSHCEKATTTPTEEQGACVPEHLQSAFYTEDCGEQQAAVQNDGSDSESFNSGSAYNLSKSDSSDVEADKYPYEPIDYHSVKFKVIGSTKESCYQAVLQRARARDLIESGVRVTVMLIPEPSNIMDSQAIAFMCELDGKLRRIGYIVKEILPYVHTALRKAEIVKVEFAWIKYITDWSRSGPGFFACVSITKKGRWPYPVVRAASKR